MKLWWVTIIICSSILLVTPPEHFLYPFLAFSYLFISIVRSINYIVSLLKTNSPQSFYFLRVSNRMSTTIALQQAFPHVSIWISCTLSWSTSAPPLPHHTWLDHRTRHNIVILSHLALPTSRHREDDLPQLLAPSPACSLNESQSRMWILPIGTRACTSSPHHREHHSYSYHDSL